MPGLTLPQRFAAILVLFALLLAEELTFVALGVLALALFWRWRRWPLRPRVLQLLGALIFAAAYLMLGRSISPEMGLNILFGVTVVKWLEAREERDWRMLTLGCFVLYATGSLFVRTPVYALASFAALLAALAGLGTALEEQLRFGPKALLSWALKALPVSILLFIFFPRFSSGVWAPPRLTPEGQVGFSPSARPADVGELQLTGAPAFHVLVSPPPPPEERYWQGITLSFTDGWNWSALPREEALQRFEAGGRIAPAGALGQDFIHSRPTDRPFALGKPLWWESDLGELVSEEGMGVRLPSGAFVRRYTATSLPTLHGALSEEQRRELTRLPRKARKLLAERFPSQQLGPLIAEARRFLTRPGVQYTLSPGRIADLESFLQAPRGWCTHFASFVTLLLRAKGFPARLVSGYFGGEVNPETQHLSVTEDDAHVWPEVHDGERWVRLDPTLWVAPQRALLSGRAFHQAVRGLSWWQRLRPGFVDRSRQWIEAMNFRFLVWSENFDREAQQSLAESFLLELRDFYRYGLWGTILCGALLFLWQHLRLTRGAQPGELAQLFHRETRRRQRSGELWWRIWNHEVFAHSSPDLRRLRRRLRRELGR